MCTSGAQLTTVGVSGYESAAQEGVRTQGSQVASGARAQQTCISRRGRGYAACTVEVIENALSGRSFLFHGPSDVRLGLAQRSARARARMARAPVAIFVPVAVSRIGDMRRGGHAASRGLLGRDASTIAQVSQRRMSSRGRREKVGGGARTDEMERMASFRRSQKRFTCAIVKVNNRRKNPVGPISRGTTKEWSFYRTQKARPSNDLTGSPGVVY